MEISAKSDYAVRALLTLAVAHGQLTGEQLAERQGLPQKFLETILADLRRGGLVVSQRGAHGGYRLAREPALISVGDVIRVVDGPLARIRGSRPHEMSYDGAAEHLANVWVAVRAALREVLDGTSLQDVLTGELPDAVRRLTADPRAWHNVE
ncbi:MAG: RrF2 family transcriptional regulator [Actinomycetota bacterium]